jgi:hypothetical protein
VTGPTWLLDGLAAVMIATAVYCACHLVVSSVRLRHADPDVDLMHVGMGIAMAGMVLAAFGRRGDDRWGLAFAAAAGWFALRGLLALLRRGIPARAGGHHFQHVLACGAMVYMLVGLSTPAAQAGAATSGPHGAMAAMGDPGAVTTGVTASPALSLVLAVALLCYAGWNVAELVTAGTGCVGARGRDRVLAPRLAVGCQIATSVTMAYLLLSG